MPTAAIYTRLSSADEDKTASDPKQKSREAVMRQQAECRALAAGLPDAHTIELYEDNDISAFSGKHRPEYRRMLGDVSQGRVDLIIAWHPDRLYRRTADLVELIDVTAQHNVKIATVNAGHIDLTTATGKMVARLLGVTGEYEVEHNRERMLSARKARLTAGRWNGGTPPLGYTAVDGRLVVNEIEAAALREAAHSVLNGLSLRLAVKQLNATLGRNIASQYLGKLLCRPSLAGLAVHQDKVIGPAQWPAIFDDATHTALCALLQNPSRASSPMGGARRYLGSSLYVCGACGGRITAEGGSWKGEQKYACKDNGCVARRASSVDSFVTEAVTEKLRQPETISALASITGGDLTPLYDERRALSERLAQLVKAFAAGVIDIDSLTNGAAAARDRLSALESEITRRSSHLSAGSVLSSTEPWTRFTVADLEVKRAVIDALMTVVIRPAAKGRPPGWKVGQPYFDPRGVEIVWKA